MEGVARGLVEEGGATANGHQKVQQLGGVAIDRIRTSMNCLTMFDSYTSFVYWLVLTHIQLQEVI